MGLARGDSESQALVRERLAGLEKEVPLLRQDNDRLRNDIGQLRVAIDDKFAEQQRYLDRKISDMTTSIISARQMASAVVTTSIDSRVYWIIISIGVAVAASLILLIAIVLQSR